MIDTAPSKTAPRISPGTVVQTGRLNHLIARAIGLATGGEPPHLFTTLARHRRLFRPWLRFAGALMPRGALPRADTELLILRVAHNCDCEYERRHHVAIARQAGLTEDHVAAALGNDPQPAVLTSRQSLLLRAADQLHERHAIPDELWSELRQDLSEVELIELCMLVGHYEMLAMTINSLRIEPDPPVDAQRLTGVRRLLLRRGR